MRLKKITVGDTIVIRYSPEIGGNPVDFGNVTDLSVKLVNTFFGVKITTTYTIEGPVLVITCGYNGHKIGKYQLTVSWIKNGITRTFRENAFELVSE